MHPAKSVIFFTTASGAGYGLMIWLALLPSFGFLSADFFFGFVALGFKLAIARRRCGHSDIYPARYLLAILGFR